MHREPRNFQKQTDEIIDHVPGITPASADVAKAAPTKDNPEIFKNEDAIKTYSIPRSAGGETAMYQHGRFFDEKGREKIIFRGLSPEEIDGQVGYPEKVIDREAFETREEKRRAMQAQLNARVVRATVEVGSMAAADSQERQRRLEMLYAPIIRPELPEQEVDYSFLFVADDGEAQRLKDEQDARAAQVQPIKDEQARYDSFIDEGTKRNSAEYLTRVMAADPQIRRILTKRLGEKVMPLEAVEAIRERSEVRLEMAMYLLDKLNRSIKADPTGWPYRVIHNGQKSTDFKELPVACSSREYVVYLALAKIDGSFNGLRATDSVEYNQAGEVITGQHRYSADTLLNLGA